MGSQAFRDSLSKGDEVFVLVRLGTDVMKTRRAVVINTTKNAAKVLIDGEARPKRVHYSRMSLTEDLNRDSFSTESDEIDLDEYTEDETTWCPSCGTPPGNLHALDCGAPGVETHKNVLMPEPDLVPSKPRKPRKAKKPKGKPVPVPKTVDEDEGDSSIEADVQAYLEMSRPLIKRLEARRQLVINQRDELDYEITRLGDMLNDLYSSADEDGE